MKVWAHRGASGYAPENTLPAFQKAVELGADGVELDIQLTKDGEIVVIHDETLDRTTDGSGWVKDHTLGEIKKLDASYQNLLQGGKVVQTARLFPDCRSVRIPTMREVFELLKPTGLTINIELKTGVIFYPGIVDRILSLTEETGMAGRVIYSSFNHYTLQELHEKNPEAPFGILYADGALHMPEYAVSLGATALHPALYNLQVPGVIETAKKKGLAVNAWTADRPEYIALCMKAGVDTVITGYPDMAQNVMAGQARQE